MSGGIAVVARSRHDQQHVRGDVYGAVTIHVIPGVIVFAVSVGRPPLVGARVFEDG